MGGVLNKWRREESAEEVLQSLEKQLQSLELAQQKNEQRYQRFIGLLMFYSILLYIIGAVLFYFYYFPKRWKDRIVRSIPMLVFPLLIYCARKTLHYFFTSRKRKNAQKLEELRSKKQKVIEDVKEKETYKKAKEILDKFDPDSSLLKSDGKEEQNTGKPVPIPTSGTELRQRNQGRSMSTPNSSFSQQAAPFSTTPMVQVTSPLRGMSPAMQRKFFIHNIPPGTPPGPPKPIPVKPKERTVADKFVDYLVGDGPNNRYALICKVCHSHNGMALMEDFEYTTFRCCYCYHLNEARKQRPSAPPLASFSTTTSSRQNSDATAVNEKYEHSTKPVTTSKLVQDSSGKKNSENCSDSQANEVENIPATEENSKN